MRKIDRDLRILTLGEAHWLARRRLGLTQAQMAARQGISRHTYQKLERLGGQISLPSSHPQPSGVQCIMARRRLGWTLEKAARQIGISHVTLLKWENESDARLVSWWKKRSWIF